MDKTKPPGIIIESVILAESNFKREPQIPHDLEFNINYNIVNSFSPDSTKLLTELTTTVTSKGDIIKLLIKYVGIFSLGEDKNMTLKEFADMSAAAILFPYVREEIHNMMLKASMPKILILPPANLYAAIKNATEQVD